MKNTNECPSRPSGSRAGRESQEGGGLASDVLSFGTAGTTLTVIDVFVGRPRISVAMKSGLVDVAAGCGFLPLGFALAVGGICSVGGEAGWAVACSLTIGVGFSCGVSVAFGAQAVRMMARTVKGKSYVDPLVAGKLIDRVANKQEQLQSLITDKLTGREVDILRLIAHGLSNSEISERLHLSEGTVRNHVSAILSKLDVSDRTQAAIIAIRHGLDK